MRTLYKFVKTQGSVQNIASGLLKFAKIDELNDPSELAPLMHCDAVRASHDALLRDGYTQEQFEWLGCQEAVLRLLSPETCDLSRPATIELANRTLANPRYRNLSLMKQQQLQTISLIRSGVGVLSLTERFDSLPMWAHYSEQATGYVVCFDGLNREFPGDATGSLNVLKPVKYVEDLLGMTFDPATQDDLFFCKFQDWQYEREWRVTSALSACKLSTDGKMMHLRIINPAIVTGVICGWKVPPSDVKRLATELGRINPNLKVQVASLDRGRVVLSDRIS